MACDDCCPQNVRTFFCTRAYWRYWDKLGVRRNADISLHRTTCQYIQQLSNLTKPNVFTKLEDKENSDKTLSTRSGPRSKYMERWARARTSVPTQSLLPSSNLITSEQRSTGNLQPYYYQTSVSVTSTKLRLYNAYISLIMSYGSECRTVKKADVQRTDALDQWWLWRILDIRWHDFIRNDAVRPMTQQSPLSSVVKSRRLSLFGYVAWMSWLNSVCATTGQLEKTPGRPLSTWIWTVFNDLSSFGMELPEAREAAQNWPFWRRLTKHSTMHL